VANDSIQAPKMLEQK